MKTIKNVFEIFYKMFNINVLFCAILGILCGSINHVDELKYENARLKIQIKIRDQVNEYNCKTLKAIETFEPIVIMIKK